MSGSFNEIDVPPTLVSFAVDVSKHQNIISDEFKEAGNILVKIPMKRDEYDLPDYDDFMEQMNNFSTLAKKGLIKSAWAVTGHGIAEAVCKMGFGNKLGAEIYDTVGYDEMFGEGYGDIIAEMSEEDVALVKAGGMSCAIIGKVTKSGFAYKDAWLTEEEALNAWTKPLESVFPTATAKKEEKDAAKAVIPLYENKTIITSKFKTAKPTVFIPVFPGTNCEYDTLRAFEKAGANVNTCVFRNRNEQDIKESVEAYVNGIRNAQILMFPGGFSAGDEPDGSGKFIATAFRNEKLKEAVNDLIKNRDGLVLGICNGFQAIIKLGLVPYGEICEIDGDSPTLTRNSIGRHISKSVYTKVVSNKSPWLAKAELGGVYSIPASHGEGRFVANDEWLKKLIANGQVATQYVDVNGNPSFDEDFNPNLSYMSIEGITDPTGRILGKMAHSERIGEGVAKNIYGDQDQMIFEAGVEYFK